MSVGCRVTRFKIWHFAKKEFKSHYSFAYYFNLLINKKINGFSKRLNGVVGDRGPF